VCVCVCVALLVYFYSVAFWLFLSHLCFFLLSLLWPYSLRRGAGRAGGFVEVRASVREAFNREAHLGMFFSFFMLGFLLAFFFLNPVWLLRKSRNKSWKKNLKMFWANLGFLSYWKNCWLILSIWKCRAWHWSLDLYWNFLNKSHLPNWLHFTLYR
jgi:hypothetical protein